MPTLYDVELSDFGQPVKIALHEKCVDFELKSVTPDAGEAESHDASPCEEMPTLVNDDRGIIYSTIIPADIEEPWPSSPLLPADLHAPVRKVQL